MDTTNTINPNQNYFTSGKTFNTENSLKATPPATPLDASTLNAGYTNLNLKPKSQTPVPDITAITSSAVTVPTAPQAPQQTTSEKLSESLAGLFGQTKGKAQDLKSTVSASTLPYESQLNEVETQIKTHQANALLNQEKAMQRGETLGFASREAQAIQRTDAIEALKLSAIAEGLRGNIALAEKRATQAIEAKYAVIDKQIEDTKTNIYNNYDSMSPAQKKKADATLLRIDAQDAFVKERKEDDKITQGFIQEAIATSATNGTPVPNLVLQRANQAETPTEALKILSPYMVDANAKALKLEQLKKTRLENAKLENETSVDNGNYTPKQLTALTKLNQDVSKNATYTKTTSMRNYGDNVIASLSLGSGVGDISAINQFQKVIDEGAVTRDQDVKLIQSSQSLANKLKAVVSRLESGQQLSPELRKQMREAVEKMYEKQVDALQKDPYISAKKKEAELYGLTTGDTILGELGSFTDTPKTSTVKVNGIEYEVGKIYTDKDGNWVVDANGKWTKQ